LIRLLPLLLCASAILVAERKPIRPPSSPTAGPYSAGIITDKFVYVSGHVGPEPGGKFAPGDVKTQTKRCLELVRKVLVEAGLDYQNVVSTTLYLTDIRTLPVADTAYREVFQGSYPARTEVESPLLIPEALAEVSAIAVRGDPRANIYLRTPGWAAPTGPFSHAVSAAGTLFLSTLRPVDPATGKLVGNTIEAQTEQLIANQKAVLTAMKMGFADVASSRVYLTDASYAAGFDKTYKKLAAGANPGRATILMTPFEPGHLVQVQSVAISKSESRQTVYVAGTHGRTSSGQFASNDIKAQTRQALESIQQQLSKKGMTVADVAEAVVWLRDPRHAAEMNSVYRDIVKPNPPARATVRISPLHPQALIEIMMTATR
jgi:2-iminobutanoate/2-iminopropanoate deaminase